MKYKLVNLQTKEEHLCDKVSIDGFEYYALKTDIKLNDYITDGYRVIKWIDNQSLLGRGKVLATNNPNIDIPKVVDETDKIAEEWFLINGYNQFDYIHSHRISDAITTSKLFKTGYNKSQETHPFSEEDMIEFTVWLNDTDRIVEQTKHIDFSKSDKQVAKELLQLWKEQQPKIVYYE